MKNNKQNRNRKRKFHSASSSSKTHDLFVPLPSRPPLALHVRSIADRLKSIEYHGMALTYTVFGAPQQHVASQVLPDSVFPSNSNKSPSTILACQRRLHVIAESVSDIAAFSSMSTSPWWQEYHFISVAPRNAATFRQACLAPQVDIVTLDYASVRGGLPYSIVSSTDLRALFARGAVLEMPYAAAVLQPSLRSHFLQACRELELACLGVSRPHLLLSSGPSPSTTSGSTNPNEEDVAGELALHSYTDVLHMITTVTGLKRAWFRGGSDVAIRHGERRRAGGSFRLSTELDLGTDSSRDAVASNVEKRTTKPFKVDAETKPVTRTFEPPETKEEIQGEDGFISF